MNNSTFSVIGSDVIITGNVAAEVDLHIDGRVEGDVKCQSLVQGESSEVHGSIVAQSAKLSGLVKGSIDARDLVIERSARITGDVAYDTISIEQGAHIDGSFKHKSTASKTPRATGVKQQGSKPAKPPAPSLELTTEAAE
ncbi:polymer-forming cytoskeletal protein [Sphingorhabdus sp. Alg239-R122]|uniref:bactofilin family protein n=1 Tax=Sphingorhabdus sp. Alg239-R122 TaxID=2305989 RepID=UPI001F080490|nr:polymer-forming cytoskeletal protein [Sphingorhabdus sp. Alg239-R122]